MARNLYVSGWVGIRRVGLTYIVIVEQDAFAIGGQGYGEPGLRYGDVALLVVKLQEIRHPETGKGVPSAEGQAKALGNELVLGDTATDDHVSVVSDDR